MASGPPVVPRPERPVGQLERLAYDRADRLFALAYPNGVPSDPRQTAHPLGYWFDAAVAERPVQFVEQFCRHHKGEWAGQPLILEEWQRFIIRQVFGWQRGDGSRLYRIAYVEVPRKNGKTEVAAALGNYLLVADHEEGAEIYSAATKKDQAKIAHDAASAMVARSPDLRKWIKPYRNNLHCRRLGSKFEPLGADEQTLDGLNPHGVIIDELHAHRTRGVWDVLDTAFGSRRQPLLLAITTAGIYDPESIGWIQHQHATHVLESVIEDDAFFGFVAAADPEDDWTQPATWTKANPNLGVSVKLDYLARQAKKAESQPSFLNTFLRLHLGQWTQQRERWIAIEDWNACEARDLTPAEMREREEALAGAVCYGGLDLSTKLDITAALLVFPRDDEVLELVCRFWVPEERIRERVRRDRVPYDAWVRDGWLLATPGNVIDYDVIRAEVGRLAARFDVRELGYDPWNATQLALQLQGDGITVVEIRQGYKTLSEPSKEWEARTVARRIRHGGHPVLRWMVSNVAAREDPAGNIKPDKAASGERIDGVVAGIMGLSRIIVQHDPGSVYDERGVLSFG